MKVHGINALGQAVGEVTVSGVKYAFIWLPDDDYSMSAGMNLLNSSFTSFGGSAAYDINDEGIIVGYVRANFGAGLNEFPYVWDLSGTFGSTDINLPDRVAYDINNDADPLIVGGVENAGDVDKVTLDGFIYELDSDTVTTLNAHVGGKKASALGITDEMMAEWRIAGLSDCEGPQCLPPGDCWQRTDGQYWTWDDSSAADEMAALGNCSNQTARCVGYAVNADGMVIGYANDPNDTTAGGLARRRGAAWRGEMV